MPGLAVGVGVDIGSTNTKVVSSTVDGPIRVLTHPTPDEPDRLVSVVLRLIRDIVSESPLPPVAVGISSMAETGWALGDSGPLTPLLRWDAARDPRPMSSLAEEVGADGWFAATGVRPGPRPLLGTLLDLRSSHPETLSAMRRWTGVADAVHLALTGALRTDHTLAGRSLAYRLPPTGEPLDRSFDSEMLGLVGVTPEQMPTVGLPGDPLDGLTPEAASATGLAAGTPVLVAGHDHQVAAWASGVRCSGEVANSVGTAEAVLGLVAGVSDRVPLRHEGMSLVRVVDGITEAVLAGSPSSGAFLQWMADAETGGDVEQLLSGSAERLPSPGFWLPYPSGRQSPHPDPAASVRRIGPAGDPGTEALEAVSLQAAWLIGRVQELAGLSVEWTTIIGEPVRRNPLWGKLKATLAGNAIELVITEQPVASGAALLALVRAEEAPPDSRFPTETVEPLPLVREYRQRLAEFVRAALLTKGVRPLPMTE